jgi:hypothetical protein
MQKANFWLEKERIAWFPKEEARNSLHKGNDR